MGNSYEMSAANNQGSIAQGENIQQANYLTVSNPELTSALGDVKGALSAIKDPDAREALELALTDFESQIATAPEGPEVRKRGKVLQSLALAAATPVVTETVKALLHAARIGS